MEAPWTLRPDEWPPSPCTSESKHGQQRNHQSHWSLPQSLLGVFGWPFFLSNKGKTASTSVLALLSGWDRANPRSHISCFRCSLPHMLSSKDTHHHQIAVICGGSFPFVKLHCDLSDRQSVLWDTLTAALQSRTTFQEWLAHTLRAVKVENERLRDINSLLGR